MKYLKRLVLILDIFELKRLVEKGNDSKEKIKGQDIILVMGMTGAGKTTNILKFLGYNFKSGGMLKGQKIYVPEDELD